MEETRGTAVFVFAIFPMFLFSFPTLYYLGVHLNLIFFCMLSQHHPKPKVRPGLLNSICICVFVFVHLYLCIWICVFIVVYLLLYNWTCRRRYKYTTLLSCLPPFFQIAVTLWNPLTRNTNYSCSPPVPFWQRNYFDLMWNRKLYVAINKDWKAIRWLAGIDGYAVFFPTWSASEELRVKWKSTGCREVGPIDDWKLKKA